MKKIVLLLALMLATFTLKANNILYFTYSQAARTVACLNSQDELMIYCGYENELPTYVLINEVWAEQISSSFYEIWLYGYDAYTGEEIFMPIDLECIYLVQYGKIYSAAQYLRFRTTHLRPTFAWVMPPYNHFIRAPRPTVYYYTYHYDIHRPGWHWRLYPHIHYHPYYMRHPHHPAPVPPKPYTPGREYPGYHNTSNGYEYDNLPLVGRVTAPRSATSVRNNPSGRSGNRITSDRKSNTVTSTDRISGRSTTSNAPSRNESLSGSGTRGNNISSRTEETPTRGNSNTSRTGSNTSRGGNDSGNNNSRTGSNTSRGGNDNDTTPSRSNSSTSRSDTPTAAPSTPSENKEVTPASRSNNSSSRSSNASSTRSNNNDSGVSSSSRSTSTNRTSDATTKDNSRSSSATRTPTTRSNNSGTSNVSRSSSNRTSSTRTSATPATSDNKTSTTRGTASRSGSTGRN